MSSVPDTTGGETGRDRVVPGPFRIRTGSPCDAPLVLEMFDAAIRWLVARDLTEQWGTEPFSSDPKRVAAAAGWASGGGLRICETAGRPVAAMVLGHAPPYVPPATEPEVYVVALVTSRTPEARGAGRALLDAAEHEARARGVGLLRVDCFAGNDGALVRLYESAGYEPVAPFLVGEWPGQLLRRRLAAEPR